MSSDEGLVGHVPYLRRFARALTGSQTLGDACVVSAIERILAGKAGSIPARIALYRSVVEEVDALEARPLVSEKPASPAKSSSPVDSVQRNLAALTPVGRQAFLLVAMEEFTLEDAALVLGMAPHEVSALLEDANQDIAAQIATDVVIIEDEPLIAMDLEQLVQSLGHRVVRVARTERQAIEAVKQTRPGLVLADIQLADGSSGIDAANEFLQDFSVPVIFVTAFPERLLTGLRPEPTFLISKPFQAHALKAVISQALFFDMRSHARGSEPSQ
jgi:CheY-like chemotaxis protein